MKLLRILCSAALLLILSAASLSSAEPVAKPQAVKPAQENTHWITNKSGIRHNSGCRYYKNSQGRPCTKDEGRACKKCGG